VETANETNEKAASAAGGRAVKGKAKGKGKESDKDTSKDIVAKGKGSKGEQGCGSGKR